MNKITTSILLLISVLSVIVGFLLTSPDPFNNCDLTDPICRYRHSQTIGQPLLLGSLTLTIVFIILFFTKKEVFNSWAKFAAVSIPVGIILIATTPTQCSASLGVCFDRKLASLWIAVIYLIVSLSIIIFKSIKLRKAQNLGQPVNK